MINCGWARRLGAKSSAGVGSQKQRHLVVSAAAGSAKRCHGSSRGDRRQELQIMKVDHGACYTALNAAFQTELRPAQPSSEPSAVISSVSLVAASEGLRVRAMVGSQPTCTMQHC